MTTRRYKTRSVESTVEKVVPQVENNLKVLPKNLSVIIGIQCPNCFCFDKAVKCYEIKEEENRNMYVCGKCGNSYSNQEEILNLFIG